MPTNSEIFKRLMSNILLAEPITPKGKSALTELGIYMTEKEYLKKIYVDPFTLYQRKVDEKPDVKFDPDDGIKYTRTVELNFLKSIKSSFESRIQSLNDSLYVIKGGAGSGKTTYVHHLKQEFINIKFCFCDFEQASPSIILFGQPYDFGRKYDNNVWKFISIIISKIDRTLFSRFEIYGFTNHKSFMRELLKTYRRYFSITTGPQLIADEAKMWEFFDCFEKYVKTKEDISSLQIRLKKLVIKHFDFFDNNRLLKDAVTYACSILIRLFFCLNRISASIGNELKYICVIDNIEYFVPFDEIHPIQECELQTIMNGIADSTSKIRPTIQKWKELFPDYKTFFGFLLVTRDTSVSLAEYKHYDDYMKESEIDITNWFCIDDIYNKKTKYFKDFISCLRDNPYYIAYRYIISDVSQYNWGMYQLVSKMYNNNYRRIGLDVVNAIVDQPESELVYFNEKWKGCLDKTYSDSTKHMCRKFIFRILLDHIQRTNYFGRLLVENNNAASNNNSSLEINKKNSYARKIATILHRESLILDSRKHDDEIVEKNAVNAENSLF